jgi:predicted polyphosphate/ATP-dependent NAD kinase
VNEEMLQREKKAVLRVGLIVNPVAGLGGPAALKGSDAPDTSIKAAALGLTSQVPERVLNALGLLKPHAPQIEFFCASGVMGQNLLIEAGHRHRVCYQCTEPTCSEDTFLAAQCLLEVGIDILLFAGGDGTARDVQRAVKDKQTVLGIPAGVKMHSGVFAVTPKAVASVLESLLSHRLVAVRLAEVRDIDEASYAQGRVITRHFGDVLIPDDQLLVQSVKCSGLQDDEIALGEIAAYISETLEDDVLYVLGSGGSLQNIKRALGVEASTLLGIDLWFNGECIAKDVSEPELYTYLKKYHDARLLISVIGGQGVVLGRGNQQLSARVLNKIGISNLQFVSTQQRLQALEGRALLVDSGDDKLDAAMSGYHKVLCGYEDFVLYEVQYLN